MTEAGWHIDPMTLLPVIHDESTFRQEHAQDPALEALVALWSGHPIVAERLLQQLVGDQTNPRFRALRADSLRDQGRHEEAIREYRDLVAEAEGTALEAVLRQHLGKAYFVAGRLERARTEFARALALRVRDDAAAELLASSRLAIDRVDALLGSD
jgi:tetratricopeptide (TPR) repeat protein